MENMAEIVDGVPSDDPHCRWPNITKWITQL